MCALTSVTLVLLLFRLEVTVVGPEMETFPDPICDVCDIETDPPIVTGPEVIEIGFDELNGGGLVGTLPGPDI